MICARCNCECERDVSGLCAACYSDMNLDFDTTPPPDVSARLQRIDAECVRAETREMGA